MRTGNSFRQAITSLVAREHENVGLSITAQSIRYGVTVMCALIKQNNFNIKVVYVTVNL